MADPSNQLISAEHAAGLIYKTATPDANQVAKVRDLMRDGWLRRSKKRPSATTRGAVAEYLAAKELRKQEAQRAGNLEGKLALTRPTKQAPEPSFSREASDRHLRRVYSSLLNDYFLSLISYRRARDRSQLFQNVVLCSQLVLLVAIIVGNVWMIQSILWGEKSQEEPWMATGRVRVQQNTSAEKMVILKWMETTRPAGELLDLLPARPRPGGTTLRARLRFQLKEKEPQMEDSVFVINGDEVLRTESPDAEDELIASE